MLKGLEYLRKSTDDKKRQILSLKAQRRVSAELCRQYGIRRAKRYEESISAKQPGRPMFNEMLDECERRPGEYVIVCWAINRLFRNPVDEGRLRWLLQRGVIRAVRTATREYLPADAGLMLAVEGGQASDELTKLRANVARGIEQKLLDGAWPGCRPPGYIYDYTKKNIVPHPRLGKLVTLVFTEVASNGGTLDSTSRRLFDFGFKTKKGLPWPKSKVQSFLTNKLYMGVMEWGPKVYEGQYETLVSPAVFAAVARRLKERSKPRKSRHLQQFPLRGLFVCSCGAMLTAQVAHGNGGTYRYYRCGRTKARCEERYLSEASIVDQIYARFSALGLTPGLATKLREILDSMRRADEDTQDAQLEAIERELLEVQVHLNNLTLACTRLAIDEESYTHASTELLTQKAFLKHKKRQIEETSGSEWFEPAIEAVSRLQASGKKKSEISVQQLAALTRETATNHRFSRRTVEFEWAEPYAYAAQLLAPLGVSEIENQCGGYTGFDSRPILLSLAAYLRTHFQSTARRSGRAEVERSEPCPDRESNRLKDTEASSVR